HSMAPRDNAPNTYSKFPTTVTATEEERKQRIKQRPPPLPPFNQLYCTKNGQSLNSPFHLASNTRHQTNNLGQYVSSIGFNPISSSNLLSVPCQSLGRFSCSPGLSPSFYYDPFDKLLRYKGNVGSTANMSPYGIYNTSCSSIEDVMSPAGLLFSSPMPPVQKYSYEKSKNIKKPKKQKTNTTTIRKQTSSIIQNDNGTEKRGQQSRELKSSKKSTKSKDDQEKCGKTSLNGNILNSHNDVGVLRKTPDFFFTSSWVTRRRKYKNDNLMTEINKSNNLDLSAEKINLHRSCSVPQIRVIHPEESDNSFMSSRSPSNIPVSSSIIPRKLK
ncbi:unnamed protein product, partial [Meganyctiphanes norvegica]